MKQLKSILACGLFVVALCVGFAKPVVGQAYANPSYTMYNATVTERESMQGCNRHKVITSGDLMLFDDGTWTLTGPINTTGAWAQTSNKVVWLRAEKLTDVTDVAEFRAAVMCNEPVEIAEPTVTVTKSKLLLNSKGDKGKFVLSLKGYTVTGEKFAYTYVVKGTVTK